MRSENHFLNDVVSGHKCLYCLGVHGPMTYFVMEDLLG